MQARARTTKVERMLKYTFSRDEIVLIAQESAAAAFSRNVLESELDSIKADYKGRIGLLETTIDKSQRKIRDGYEMREIECEVQFHTPEDGMKRVVRLDTGEEVAVEYMLPHERQEILPFVQPEAHRVWPKYDPETGTYDKSSALRLRKDLGDGDWFEILLLEVDEGGWQGTYEFKVGQFEKFDQPITDHQEADRKSMCIWSAGLQAQKELTALLATKLKKGEREKLTTAIEAIQAYRILLEDKESVAEMKAEYSVSDSEPEPQPA